MKTPWRPKSGAPRRRAIVWGTTIQHAAHEATGAGLQDGLDHVVLVTPGNLHRSLMGLQVDLYEAIGWSREELMHARYGFR